jgi:hypothetical protein
MNTADADQILRLLERLPSGNSADGMEAREESWLDSPEPEPFDPDAALVLSPTSEGRWTDQPATARLVTELEHLARTQAEIGLYSSPVGRFTSNGHLYSLPRYIFLGPTGGGDPVRLGLFAGIHGDEPEGSRALVDFLKALVAHPELAQGYHIYAYPVCNPTGFEDGTRHARSGRDLNRLFWQDAEEPEIYFLEQELEHLRFDGLVSLHSDDTTDGLYAFVRGAVLTEALARPMLEAAQVFLPRADGDVIDGFPARNAIVDRCYPGVLGNSAKMKPVPFEIVFETPQRADPLLQRLAAQQALLTLLQRYREFIAQLNNI